MIVLCSDRPLWLNWHILDVSTSLLHATFDHIHSIIDNDDDDDVDDGDDDDDVDEDNDDHE